ncbi:MAG TPA: hypothetical protein VJY36_04225 [Candidatus Bathyarchaeia archaeon]|nr:hypothetical protein [Candidatus Bathyarchaeia archaeon]
MAGEWTSIRSAIIKPGVGGKSLKTEKTKKAIFSVFAILRMASTGLMIQRFSHSLPFCEVET